MDERTDVANDAAGAVGSRQRGIVAAALTVVLLGATFLVAAGLTSTAGAVGDITIDQQLTEPSPEGCVDTNLARLNPSQFFYAIDSTDDYFKLVVTNTVNFCDPLDAIAVIYGMPDGGGQWPQTRQSYAVQTIQAASVTTFSFSKDCSPVQFDVVTGDAENPEAAIPLVIDPLGAHHNDLLFVGDTNTAQQWFGSADCNPTTTTTTSTTTTSSTTSTTQPQVAGVTTIVGGGSSTTAPPATVEAATATNANGVAANSLALTGARSTDLALFGGVLILGGLSLLVWSRRGRSFS